jgi:hypothetical protein
MGLRSLLPRGGDSTIDYLAQSVDHPLYPAVITRPITAFDVLLVATSVLLLVIVGLRCVFAAEKMRDKALRNYEKTKPTIRNGYRSHRK